MKNLDPRANLASFANRLSRREKQVLQIGLDCILLISAAAFAFMFRLGFEHEFNTAQVTMIVGAPLTAIPLFVQFGLYRAVLRYLPEKALLTIFRAVVLAGLLWTALAFFTGSYGGNGVPRTVPFLYGVFSFLAVSASRFAAKWVLINSVATQGRRRTLIYGAGKAGTRLAIALRHEEEANVLGFVDDDAELQGRDVAGLRVYPPARLEQIVENLGIQEIVLCLPSASGAKKLKIGRMLATLPVEVRVLPSRPSGTVAERFRADALEKLDIAELIGRSPVPPDNALIEQIVKGRRIVITGAGGSIGSRLSRFIDMHSPRELFLVDNNEYALYKTARLLSNARQMYPVHYVLGSVSNEGFMRRLLQDNDIDIVFHAAAYKHVDLVEQNVREGIRNNVFGTEVPARIAFEEGVRKFVLISSDKAVNPTSAMGATKRLGELIVSQYAELAHMAGSDQSFLSVRFGNVIGSSGSVVPLFSKQIEKGGPVTVTHRDVTRYFMAVSEAVELIVQSAGLSKGGETFMLDMGEPISIYEMARDMIALAGLKVRDEKEPDGDIPIEFIGLRSGEKMHEELWHSADATISTRHPKIMMVNRRDVPTPDIGSLLTMLRDAMDSKSETELRILLLSLTAELNRSQFSGPQSRIIPLPRPAKTSAG